MKHALTMAAGLAALASPVAAEELKKLPEPLDPSKAYVIVELGTLDDGGIKGEIVLARYDSEGGDIRGYAGSAPELNKKALRAAHEGARKGFVKDKERGTRLHLIELEPDLYVVEAANGTTFALGSRTFRATPGSVTDLGVITVATDWAEGEAAAKFGVGDAAKLLLFGAFAGPKQDPRPTFLTQRARSSSDLQIPPVLVKDVRPVVWQATDVTFGNHLGGLVNRFGGRSERVLRAASDADDVPSIAAADASPTE